MAFFDVYERLCKDINKTPTEVGRENGIKQQVISQWKKRGSTPNAATVARLADYFGVSMDYLLGNDKSEKRILKNIDALLKKKRWTRKGLAEKIGVPFAELSSFFREDKDMPQTLVQAIARALGVTTTLLTEDIRLRAAAQTLPNGQFVVDEKGTKQLIDFDRLRALVIKRYDALNYRGQLKVADYIKDLEGNPAYKEDNLKKDTPDDA